MKIKNKRRGERALAMFITFVMLSSFAVAIAITSPVELIEPRLNLFLGEDKEIFYYAHVASGEGNSVNVQLVKGSEVLTLIGPSTISVQPNTQTKIFFKATVPSDAVIGDSYQGEIIFRAAGEGQGTLGLGTSVKKVFTINIVERPKIETESSTALVLVLLAIAIIVLALVIYYLVRKRRK